MNIKIFALVTAFSLPLAAMESLSLQEESEVSSESGSTYYERFEGKVTNWFVDLLIETYFQDADYEESSDSEDDEHTNMEGDTEIIEEALNELFEAIQRYDNLEEHLEKSPEWLLNVAIDEISLNTEDGDRVNAGKLLDRLSNTHPQAMRFNHLVSQFGRRRKLIKDMQKIVNTHDDFLDLARAFVRHIATSIPVFNLNPFTEIFLKEENMSLGTYLKETSSAWSAARFGAGEMIGLYADRWDTDKTEEVINYKEVFASAKAFSQHLIAQIKLRARPYLRLNPFKEITRRDGKSFGDIVEENASSWTVLTSRVASAVIEKFPDWETLQDTPRIKVQRIVSDKDLHREEGEVSEEEMLPQKSKSFYYNSSYKLLGGALGVIIATIICKKYLSSGPSQEDSSKAPSSETQVA